MTRAAAFLAGIVTGILAGWTTAALTIAAVLVIAHDAEPRLDTA